MNQYLKNLSNEIRYTKQAIAAIQAMIRNEELAGYRLRYHGPWSYDDPIDWESRQESLVAQLLYHFDRLDYHLDFLGWDGPRRPLREDDWDAFWEAIETRLQDLQYADLVMPLPTAV